ncbi:hypothetical protein EII40_07665 [Tannerella forsythia]|uniref:Uncharacterized protein n=2 Tax=Tannerella forsythia TaxID=28112 RepID=A0A3P1XQL4_TANFO|nr:hypothetical protein EII40_07665 [Tannerella forsythia]
MTLLERYKEMHEKGTEAYFDADEIIRLLEYFEDENDFEGFTQVLELGLKLHPENIGIKIKECKVYIYQEKYAEALDRIKSIGDDDDPELLLLKVQCLYVMDLHHEADELLDQHPVDDELRIIYEDLTPILSEIGKNEVAFKLVKRAIQLFPDSVILKEEHCYHEEMAGNLQRALQICRELIDIDPYSTDYWYIQGRLLSNLGQYEEAIHSFDFALTCDEDDVEVRLLRAYCLFMNENYEKAIEAYLDLLSDKKDITDHIEPILAECYLKADDFERAYTLFNKLLGKPEVLSQVARYKTHHRIFSQTDQNIDKTAEYLNKMFFAARKMQENELPSDKYFLHAQDIRSQKPFLLPPDGLSEEFIKNKHHLN